MGHLTSAELAQFFCAIGIIILIAKFVGSVCKKIKFPVVVGELLTGVFLGPTVLGAINSQYSQFLLPRSGNITFAFDALFNIAVVMLLFAAGLEINLSKVLQNKKATFLTSLMGIFIPFVLGFGVAYYHPHIFKLETLANNQLAITAAFIGVALAVSALPVLARILLEINLFHTYIGIVIMSAVFVTDIIAWLIFGTLLSWHEHAAIDANLIGFITLLGFILFMFTLGSKAADKYLKFSNKLGDGVGIILGVCLLSAAFIELSGFHASLGAFIAGITLNKVMLKRPQLTALMQDFVNGFFAPLFFASIGLKLNFLQNFDLALVSIILLLAFFSKTAGVSLGAYLSGIPTRTALAIGSGMNARGAMEIILCTIALNAGLITGHIFVAFVIMAILTSLVSGPLMLWLLKEKQPAVSTAI